MADFASSPERVPVDVNAVVEGARPTLQHIAGTTVALTIRLAATPLWVAAHQSDLERIIINLMMNAREAIAHTGWVTVEVRSIHLVEGPRVGVRTLVQPHVRLTVADTGGGIDADVLPRAFDPFVTTKDDHLGLGLVRVVSLVLALGGWMLVDSEASGGTRVHVCLPATEHQQT